MFTKNGRNFVYKIRYPFRSAFHCPAKLFLSDFDFCAHQFYKFRNDRRIPGPCGRCNQIAINNSLIRIYSNIFAASQCDVRADRRVSRCLSAFQHACCCQKLRAMADCRNRFVIFEKFLNDFNDSCIQSQIFRRTSACNEQTCIVRCIYRIKIRCQSEVMPSFFGVCLFAFKVMNRRTDNIAGFFIRANNVYLIAHCLHCLKRYHGFVIFCKIARQHQNFLCHMKFLLCYVKAAA